MRTAIHPSLSLLELDQKVQVDVTALADRQSPDNICLAPPSRTTAGMKLGIDTLQSGEIEVGDQPSRNELPHESLHHPRMGKQAVI